MPGKVGKAKVITLHPFALASQSRNRFIHNYLQWKVNWYFSCLLLCKKLYQTYKK